MFKIIYCTCIRTFSVNVVCNYLPRSVLNIIAIRQYLCKLAIRIICSSNIGLTKVYDNV